ncbi:MAG: polysaccharide biosynthesis tyrosine autokinase [Chitinivibrionales bacterium]
MMEKTIVPNLQRLKTDTRIRDYLAMILRRKMVFMVSLASVVLSSVFFVSQIRDVYESFSTIVIEEKNYAINQAMNLNSGRSLDFYQGILGSRTFSEMLVDSIGLNVFKMIDPKLTRERVIMNLPSNLTLKNTEYASFMHLNARAGTKELAYLLASIGTDLFRKRCQEVEGEESRRAMIEIDNQLKIVRDKLEQAEHDYQTYKERTGNISEGTTPELKTLSEAYATNFAQLGLKEADLAAEKKQLALLEATITPAEQERSPEFLKLRSRLRELEQEKMRLENLGIKMAGNSTVDREIQEIEGQLLQYKQSKEPTAVDPHVIRQWQDLRKSVLNKESDLDLFKSRLESYKTAIANYKTNNPDILNHSLELLRLQRSSEVYQNVYNVLLEKAEEERMHSTSSSAGIKIVDVARMPEQPIPKNQSRYYIIGVILGLLLGIGLALFLEFNDTSIKSNEDVERYLGVSILGAIPHITPNKKEDISIRRRSAKSKSAMSVVQYPRQILSFTGDDSVITESYRSLRTNISFVSPDAPLHTLVVTSAGPSEGKSLTTANLAMAYAQMGKKTLLIDTDLRRPVLHHFFGMKREPGFAELFIENPDYDLAIRPSGKENLSVITAGIFSANPAELIASQKMLQHIEYFKKHFDMVFFDTPPIVAVTDATLLGKKVDGVLLVIKSHHSDREFVSRALTNLNNVGVKVWGAILNDIDLTHRYSTYGYYKYYYHYYKSKKD